MGGPQQRKTDIIVLIVSSISDKKSTVRTRMADVMYTPNYSKITEDI